MGAGNIFRAIDAARHPACSEFSQAACLSGNQENQAVCAGKQSFYSAGTRQGISHTDPDDLTDPVADAPKPLFLYTLQVLLVPWRCSAPGAWGSSRAQGSWPGGAQRRCGGLLRNEKKQKARPRGVNLKVPGSGGHDCEISLSVRSSCLYSLRSSCLFREKRHEDHCAPRASSRARSCPADEAVSAKPPGRCSS